MVIKTKKSRKFIGYSLLDVGGLKKEDQEPAN